MTLLRAICTTTALVLGALGVEYGNEIAALSSRPTAYRKRSLEGARFLPPLGGSGRTEETNKLELLDIVLLASVDGKFHALNRTTGDPLWSISDGGAAGSTEVLSAMAPLVRTSHSSSRDLDLDDDDGVGKEQYIIEPQSGDIYVLTSPSAPLQPFPFSMPQLVDMSPFTFVGSDDGRLFVGKKVTTLLTIELETGRVLRTVSSDSECPWEPPDEGVKSSLTEVDLDELEDVEAAPTSEKTSTEVHIGRTDYHVTIHDRWLDRTRPRLPPQNLSFSVYGPNNQDHGIQSAYRRTADNVYVQSLPNGHVISFQARSRDSPRHDTPEDLIGWGHDFKNPIVAVFDIVRDSQRIQPFALLQPRARLEEIFPHVDFAAAAKAHKLNPEAAFVGLVGDSLFAMSPERYPLVMFDDAGREHRRPTIGTSGAKWDDMSEVDRLTERRRWKQLCGDGTNMDPRCLTGVRSLELGGRSRLRRLIDGPSPGSEVPVEKEQDKDKMLEDHKPGEMIPSPPPDINASATGVISGTATTGALLTLIGPSYSVQTAYGISLSFLTVLIFLFFALRRGRLSAPASPPLADKILDRADAPPKPANGTTTIVEDHKPPSPADKDGLEESGVPAPKTPKTPTISFKLPDPTESPNEDRDGGESDKENGDTPATPGKRKTRRGRRGKKKKGAAGNGNGGGDDGENEEDSGSKDGDEGSANGSGEAPLSAKLVVVPPTPVVQPMQSLVVSDEILGFGSHGTVVFRGSLQGRAVAVKRLLQDFVTLASREVNVLQESDDHPNVIRYYYQEAHSNFLYIALELCPASLADIVERPDQFRDLAIAFEPKRALRQITSGLRHLHALKIVHRDIKPQNILVSSAKKGAGRDAGYRMLISDFGLCKKLEIDQTSFLPTMGGAMAAGTVGWRAPEILRGEVNLDETLSDDHSMSSRGSVGTVNGSSSGVLKPTRLTKSVDIFALGCLFYYTLTNGGHPYGDRYEREVNIIKDQKSLDGLERFGEEGSEAVDLIGSMLDPEASKRPDTTACLLHPFFWDSGRRLTFLQDASDRFEIMCRDPRDPMLVQLEKGAFGVVGNDWSARLDKVFLENLGKFRKYDGKSVQDLMRALRNKKHHYQDLPEHVKRHVGSMPDGYLAYFTRRYPQLFLHVYDVVADSMLRHESMFRSYFELHDSS